MHKVQNKEVECKRATPQSAAPRQYRPNPNTFWNPNIIRPHPVDPYDHSYGYRSHVMPGGTYHPSQMCPMNAPTRQTGPTRVRGAIVTDKIFVGGLPDLTNDEFKEYFGKFGEVTESVLMLDKATNRPRGFGFITFSTVDAVEKVMRRFDAHYLKDKWVECKLAMPRQPIASTYYSGPSCPQRPSGMMYQQPYRRYVDPSMQGTHYSRHVQWDRPAMYVDDSRANGQTGYGPVFTNTAVSSYAHPYSTTTPATTYTVAANTNVKGVYDGTRLAASNYSDVQSTQSAEAYLDIRPVGQFA
eukprot:CAMPEP_0113848514 /NCGR_PEP_ID=MMETSP0372-20130328/2528_1 /TAXON_ID=340204 /ORGANISM="Lankesteria abbotti" /LENGTH=298 /DNA_ID=CAMNT_0000818023 /DNA_START=148 /DNA_END=1044 /DNA_ORIENTATION=+ /assembly_acc=CAM_ASM_000359